MDIGIICKRYAKALIEYANEHNQADVVYQQLMRLRKSFIKEPRTQRALENPVLTTQEKWELIRVAASDGRTMADGAPSDGAFDRFIQLVLREHREDCLLLMCLSYIDQYHQLKHIGVAKLTTAVSVDAETKRRIRQTAEHIIHADVELETEVNPDIEGGFIFDINDYRIDASIATQLKRVKRQFIEKNKRIV